MPATIRIPSAILITIALLLTGQPARAFKRTNLGESIKNFQLETPAGEPWQLGKQLGSEATVVVFWAVWNPRSAEILADLQQVYEEHGPPELQVVAVNAENGEWDPATLDKIDDAVATIGVTFPVVVDKTLDTYAAYGVKVLPSAVVANGEGTVVELLQGYSTAARLDFRDTVLQTLGVLKREPATAATETRKPPAPPKVRRKVQMAKLLIKKRRPLKAVAVLEEAIAEAPDFEEAYRVLIEAHTAAEQPEAAAAAQARLAEVQGYSVPDP